MPLWLNSSAAIATIIGMLVSALGIWLVVWQHRRTRCNLVYRRYERDLVIPDEATDIRKLEIRYNGKLVPSLQITVIEIINRGRPIERSDFDNLEPLKFRVQDSGRIMQQPEIIARSHSISPKIRLQMRTDLDNGTLAYGFDVEPLLINRGESFSIKVVGTNMGKLEPVARIKGGEIKDITREEDNFMNVRIPATTVAIVCSIVLFILTFDQNFPTLGFHLVSLMMASNLAYAALSALKLDQAKKLR